LNHSHGHGLSCLYPDPERRCAAVLPKPPRCGAIERIFGPLPNRVEVRSLPGAVANPVAVPPIDDDPVLNGPLTVPMPTFEHARPRLGCGQDLAGWPLEASRIQCPLLGRAREFVIARSPWRRPRPPKLAERRRKLEERRRKQSSLSALLWIASRALATTVIGWRKTLNVIARSSCDEAIQSFQPLSRFKSAETESPL
jgi:hypothetical protein